MTRVSFSNPNTQNYTSTERLRNSPSHLIRNSIRIYVNSAYASSRCVYYIVCECVIAFVPLRWAIYHTSKGCHSTEKNWGTFFFFLFFIIPNQIDHKGQICLCYAQQDCGRIDGITTPLGIFEAESNKPCVTEMGS